MYCIVLFYRAAYLEDKVIQTTSVYSGAIESTAREREREREIESGGKSMEGRVLRR